MPSLIEVDRPAEGVARLRLARPDAHNAIDLPLARDLREAIDDAQADDGVRAVLLSSTGASFSVGGDVKLMQQAGAAERPDLLAKLTNHFHAAVQGIATMPKPVVGAAKGRVGGGGLSLLVACDLVVVDEAAKIALGWALLGLSPDGGMTHHLPRLVGQKRALELAFTSPVLDGRRAVELGLANRAVPADKVDDEALALATELAKGPTRAFAKTKELLRAGHSLGEALAIESETIAQLSGEPDAGEGIDAFVEKRKPRFTGR